MQRPHADDEKAVEELITAGVLSPGARGLTNAEITIQHNGANALAPGQAGYLDRDAPLLPQVARIVRDHRDADRPAHDLYTVHIEVRTTLDSVIAVPAGTDLDAVYAKVDELAQEEALPGRERVYDDGAAVNKITDPARIADAYVNLFLSEDDLD